MDAKEFKALVIKYRTGKCTNEDKEKLFKYFDSFQDNQDIWATNEPEKRERVKQEILGGINRRINETTRVYTGGKNLYLGIAASIVFILVAGLLLVKLSWQSKSDQVFTYKTVEGQKSSITLPDSTIVTLNSSSSLTYSSGFLQNRSILLTGEAFFQVKEDSLHPFQVVTGELETTVLGTSFNINAYQYHELVQVTVKSGKVQVASNEQSHQLLPGQQVNFHPTKEQMEINEVNTEILTAWKEGIIIIDGHNLDQIFKILERWYGVNLLWQKPADAGCDLRLTFDNLPLLQVLEQLTLITGIKYEIVDQNTIKIIGEGCEI